MIFPIELLVWALMFSVPLYWAIPARMGWARSAYLAVISALGLFSLSPAILVTVAAYWIVLSVFAKVALSMESPEDAKPWCWALFVPLLLPEIATRLSFAQAVLGGGLVPQDSAVTFAFLGLSFTAIRSFVILREAIAAKHYDGLQAATALLFLPSFAAGPITGTRPFDRNAWPAAPTWSYTLTGASRIGWGAAMFLVFRKFAAGYDLSPMGVFEPLADMYRDFVVLYFDFAGYTSVAIGWALLFGLRLPENFHAPFLATSIQDFWRRWHLTLGAFFVSTYLFKPLVRKFGKPTLAIFVAFTAVGFWHTISLPYLVWGIGHGAALAGNIVWTRRVGQIRPGWLRIALLPVFWLLTMTFVAFLSSFAQAPDIAGALAFVANLIP